MASTLATITYSYPKEVFMRQHRLVRAALAMLVALLVQACAAVLASNEPLRNGLIGRVEQGMTREQVETILGAPDETMAFDNTRTVAWDYRYTDSWGFLAMFSVTFGSDGRVVSTFSRRLNDGRSSSGMT
jgi:outer membrane protein assembly factor BamE (lipoprotein component of BamABCDE complex)